MAWCGPENLAKAYAITHCGERARASASLDQEILQASGCQELPTNLPRVEGVLRCTLDQRPVQTLPKETAVIG
jgi:hypothetical protein